MAVRRMWARMRDADVGAGAGPGSAAEALAARACTNAAAAAASIGGNPDGQQRADHAGQHVTGSGGRRPRLAGRVQVGRADRGRR